MIHRIARIVHAIRQYPGRWWGITLGVTVGYYLALMAGLIIKFQHLPNYVQGYDWFSNVIMIIVSTPSLQDTLAIIAEEWVLEIGFMNDDFGMGISEWSLFLAPAKMAVVMALGALLATHYSLLRANHGVCSATRYRMSKVSTGLGATCVALTSITMSWVVCCATPTWVVGLAIMGLGVSTSLWLEPLGTWLSYAGFTALLVGVLVAAGPASVYDNRASRRPIRSHA
jgi:hypothetical protein